MSVPSRNASFTAYSVWILRCNIYIHSCLCCGCFYVDMNKVCQLPRMYNLCAYTSIFCQCFYMSSKFALSHVPFSKCNAVIMAIFRIGSVSILEVFCLTAMYWIVGIKSTLLLIRAFICVISNLYVSRVGSFTVKWYPHTHLFRHISILARSRDCRSVCI